MIEIDEVRRSGGRWAVPHISKKREDYWDVMFTVGRRRYCRPRERSFSAIFARSCSGYEWPASYGRGSLSKNISLSYRICAEGSAPSSERQQYLKTFGLWYDNGGALLATPNTTVGSKICTRKRVMPPPPLLDVEGSYLLYYLVVAFLPSTTAWPPLKGAFAVLITIRNAIPSLTRSRTLSKGSLAPSLRTQRPSHVLGKFYGQQRLLATDPISALEREILVPSRTDRRFLHRHLLMATAPTKTSS